MRDAQLQWKQKAMTAPRYFDRDYDSALTSAKRATILFCLLCILAFPAGCGITHVIERRPFAQFIR